MSDADGKPSARLPPWRTCLDIEQQQAAHYNDYVQTPIFELVDEAPRRVLELEEIRRLFAETGYVMEDITAGELLELCAAQFIVRARLA